MKSLEELQAACDRLNSMDMVDEEELAKLEAEIEARLQALEPAEQDAKEISYEESGWEILEGVSDWLRNPKQDSLQTELNMEDVESQEKVGSPGEGKKTSTVEQERGTPERGPSTPAGKQSRPSPKPDQPKFKPLTKEQKRTLQLLDKWAQDEPERDWGAKGQYGAKGERADLARSYGRLLLKTRPVSEKGELALSALESALPARKDRRSGDLESGGLGVWGQETCDRATQELDTLLNKIEHQVAANTISVARHAAGGVAAPSLIAFGEFYTKQSKLVQRTLLIGFLIVFTLFYFTFYEEEEEVEEEMIEELDKDGLGFSDGTPSNVFANVSLEY